MSMNSLAQQRAFNGAKVAVAQKPVASRAARFVVRAETTEAPKAEKAPFSAPPLNPNTPSPIFGGSTGARAAPAARAIAAPIAGRIGHEFAGANPKGWAPDRGRNGQPR